MLPKHLNEDICSLKQDEERLTITLWVEIDT